MVDTDIESNVDVETNVEHNPTILGDIICIMMIILLLVPLTIYYSKIDNNKTKGLTTSLLILIIFGFIELGLTIIIFCVNKLETNIKEEIKEFCFGTLFICILFTYTDINIISVWVLSNTNILYNYDYVIRGYLILIMSIAIMSWIITLGL